MWGGYHTLDYAESIGFENIGAFEWVVKAEVPGVGTVERHYDIFDRAGNLYELKNVSEFRLDAANQLIRDMQLLPENELSRMRWVFRGPQNEEIVRRFIETVKTFRMDLYTNQILTEANIVFFGSGRPFDVLVP